MNEATSTIRPAFSDRPAERSRRPRTVRDTDRMSAAEAKRSRKATKALGIKPPDTLRDIMAAIDALKLSPPNTTIAVWSLGPEKQPVRLHTSAGKIYLMGRMLFGELERECRKNDATAVLGQAIIPSFAGVPILDVDALEPLGQRRFAELVSTALGATA